ncbi:NAD(P)-dependent alcohol dehydrogenase [Bremerella cremea]|uniref:alcohol dehydrogenase (NADP(+)) n=1 Tax=Blastopirellula marina TaxID=124 RepID=A0A2S8FCM3_9BACT|nr:MULTISPECIES: NAD(P)-dependent alcohol dehydrogenase [Pirellulaceae]PQO29897.1 alcohol dehydrogenase [Blastopirellula marina]RCS43200.1 NAD(P)-dependent alcohol dehydrogenase [Bremerella cremea]
MTVKAYAVTKAKGDFEPFEFELGNIDPYEVDIKVESCGICHSDLSMVDDEWGMAKFPLVPGHEVVGRVSAVGDHVTHVKIGDRVGLGWHAGYCMMCDQCMSGDHNLCSSAEPTIDGRHGGFADTVRAKAPSVVKIPDGLKASEAGPLLCGGIAMFNPMVQAGLSPTDSVGVIGIGGLGHMGLKFAAAWGCHVTAFTSDSKRQEALDMGAHDTINSRDPAAIKAATGRFDLVLSTVNVPLDWNSVLATLKPRGRLMMPGAVTEPLGLKLLPDMMFKQLSVGSSPVGTPAVIRQMLEFAARHNIAPVNEHFPMSKVNDAFEHLRSGKARYRIVLDRD